MRNQPNITLLRAFDAVGNPVPGAKLSFFESGTTTPVTVYSDSAGEVPHPATILADAQGVFPPVWVIGTDPLKATMTTASDVPLNGYPIDPVAIIPSTGSAASEVSFSPITGNSATNVQDALTNLTALWNATTTYGKSIIAGANAAAVRTTLGLTLRDEDDMASDSATSVATQQSIKAYVDNALNRGAASAVTTSGTEVNISTAIPAGVRWVKVIFSGPSLSGTDDLLIQLSTGGSFSTSGYVSTSGGLQGSSQTVVSSTAGLILHGTSGANTVRGVMRLERPTDGSNRWISSHSVSNALTATSFGGGEINLGGALDGIRIKSSGTDTFDSGTVYLRWGN